jgi:hypothetical protein
MTMAQPAEAVRVVVLDDGEKVVGDFARALPKSVWPAPGPVDLFALRGETIGFQVVVDAERPLTGVHATLVEERAADAGDGDALEIDVFGERFVPVLRPSYNERYAGSLAFTAAAAPDPAAFVGPIADPLVPGDVDVAAHGRGALWIDVYVPSRARPGRRALRLHVSSREGALADRAVAVDVLDGDLPYAAARTMVYYEPSTVERRMGDKGAEEGLRRLFHAHHLSAIRDRPRVEVPADHLDDDALTGVLYREDRGYHGPGEGIGEGVFVLGAYGSIDEPSPEHLRVAEALADHVRSLGVLAPPARTDVFLYAVDEMCTSPWPREWARLFATSAAMRGVRVGATCGDDPLVQGADLVMMGAADFAPARVRAAREAGKVVWAYNGRRPFAGPMMLDVPATDLRANAWIAARYDVDRWFYWESTYWLDAGRGGEGGWDGFDPFADAETFHNAAGDHANGDGILVYPGRQVARGMLDLDEGAVLPSVRLKNLRRGIEDAGYIALARKVDAARANEVVRRVVPRALAGAGPRVAWPERGAAWLDARRELAEIAKNGQSGGLDPGVGAVHEASDAPRGQGACARSCTLGARGPRAGSAVRALPMLAFLIVLGLVRGNRTRLR